MAVHATDSEAWKEQQRFYNFLQHYDLHKYHQKLTGMGVTKVSHLKTVDDETLEQIGMSRPERNRLREKLEDNFSVLGKLKKSITGKSSRFDHAAPEVAHRKEDGPNTHHTATLIAKEEVKLGKRIGEGAHGSVYEGTWVNQHGSVSVAVKTLYGGEEIQDHFIKEADSMRALNHPHIVKLYGIVLSSPLMLIEELAPFGNLHRQLERNGPTMNLHLFHIYACQIADAMKYLEELRIVHRDLATRNVLLSSQEYIKLSDFGMARVLDEHSNIYNLSNLQTRIPIAWTALEALQQAKFSTASDVWSYGVTLWEIYSLGKTPWEGLSPIEIRDTLVQANRLGRPERCPPEVYRLLLSCWEKRPQDRPSFANIHQRIQELSPKCVRAIKQHTVAADDSSLNFRRGDVIYIIDKPKPEWIFGMKTTGEIGHFLADHVTAELDPIGHIKEKVQSGKAKVSNLPISGPVNVAHEYHWGRDGKKWVMDDIGIQELTGQMQQGARVSQTFEDDRNSSTSSGSIASPRSASPHSHPPNPWHTFSPPSPRSPSQGQAQISHGDARFLGRQHYTPQAYCVPVGVVDLEAQRQSNALVLPPKPTRQDSEDNQYVTITGALEDVPEEDEGMNLPISDDYDYLKMHSDPTRLQQIHQYQNVPVPSEVWQYREDVPAYGVSSAGLIVESDSSSSVSHTPEPARDTGPSPSLFEDSRYVDSSMLPQPLIPVPVSGYEGNRGPGGGAHVEAITPRSVQYMRPYRLPPSSVPNTSNPFLQSDRAVLVPRGQWDSVDLLSSSAPNTSNPFLQSDRAADLSQVRQFSQAGIEQRRRFVTMKSSSVENGVTNLQTARKQFPVQRSATIDSPTSARRQSKPSPKEKRQQHEYDVIPSPIDPAPSLHIHAQQANQQQSQLPLPFTRTSLTAPENRHGNQPPTPHLESVLLNEFPGTPPDVCRQALEMHHYDVQKAKEEVAVQLLMGMVIPYITSEDCRRALSHCQWKMDRAATWLMEQSNDIAERTE